MCFFLKPELIEKYTESLEIYKVTTEDGYIITMFRIRRHNPKGTILFQHPLTSNSRVYLAPGNDSLGEILRTKTKYTIF